MTIRTATPAEIGEILDWAAAEGWNPGLDDARPFHAADPGGFFVSTVEGRPVAAISVVNHDAGQSFLGLYLCLPEWRGKGIGFALWKRALDHAGTRSVGLDGVAAQQANYARSGFVLAGASRRYEGTLAPAADPAIRPVTPGDLPALIARDTAATGYGRAAFLRAWLDPTATRLSLATGDLSAFATIRRCGSGAKIGPVIAPDAAVALRLIRAALAALPAERVIIDLPGRNAALAALLEAEGFTMTFETARMYRGPAPLAAAPATEQAIATMELG